MTSGWKPVLIAAASAACLVGATRPAAANCAAGDDYQTMMEGSSVRVCPDPKSSANDNRLCPDPLGTGMLRQNVDTGEVHLLSEFCSDEPLYEGGPARGCYLDECVPPGTYRYGFATPWEDPFCGGCPPSQYFGEITVDSPLAAECALSEDNAGAEPYSGTLPWGDDGDICNDSGFGCSIGARPREIVLGFQALVALLGFGFMVRRRRANRE